MSHISANTPTRDAEQIALRYAGNVPRYTSYPTAPHFNDSVDAETYGEWLGRIEAGQDVSLYLHVPFCREMCWYCGCFTKIVRSHEPVSRYVDTLCREIDLVADQMGGRATARFIHWGGGSPTILDGNDWQYVMERLADRFVGVSDAEIAVEMDPRTTTEDYVATLARVGVNRVSIGVQEFDSDIQRAINRVQPYETTARVVEWLRESGIIQLNMDLMYGLPGQTTAHVERMTRTALGLRPQRVALFGYAHVPWMRAHQRLIDEDALPDTRARWESAAVAADILVDEGYRRVGFDHFALPDDPMASGDGGVRRNFQGYTTDDAETLIGFGASAIGSLPAGYVQNVASLRSYDEAVTGGGLPVKRGRRLSADDRLRRDVIEKVMCDLAVDLESLCGMHGMPADALDASLNDLSDLAADGMVEIDGRSITVTEAGRPLVRNVAAAFDAYLETSGARHSSAV